MRPSLNNESKDNDNHFPAKQSLRFTSINSINRKLTEYENVLKYAQNQINMIVNGGSDIFDNAFKFDFDIFEFMNYTNRPLLVLGVYLLQNAPIFDKLFSNNKVNLLSCAHFLDLCEKLYQKNPYHNHIHATDVMQFNLILLSSSFIKYHFEDYELLAAFMSAVAHDIGHIGKNNDFLIKSQHKLAVKFNNVSCLENYHIEQFHQTLQDNKANWIKHFGDKTQKYMIDIVEYGILGTDMGVYHNQIKKTLKESYNQEWVKKSYQTKLSFDEKKFIVRAMLHLSDISNPMRPFKTCQRWAHRVNEEFFSQGDAMKELGLEISMGCDRNKTDVIKNQNGFVQFCVKPLTESLSKLISELDWCLNNIDSNTQKWANLKKEQEQEQEPKEILNEIATKQKIESDNKIIENENESPSTTETSSFNSNQSTGNLI